MWCWSRRTCGSGVCLDGEDYYRPVRRRDTQVGPLFFFFLGQNYRIFHLLRLAVNMSNVCLSEDTLIRTEQNETQFKLLNSRLILVILFIYLLLNFQVFVIFGGGALCSLDCHWVWLSIRTVIVLLSYNFKIFCTFLIDDRRVFNHDLRRRCTRLIRKRDSISIWTNIC